MSALKELFAESYDKDGLHADVLLPEAEAEEYAAAWDEGKHPRGQPENAGQFGPGGAGSPAAEAPAAEAKPAGAGHAHQTLAPPSKYYTPKPRPKPAPPAADAPWHEKIPPKQKAAIIHWSGTGYKDIRAQQINPIPRPTMPETIEDSFQVPLNKGDKPPAQGELVGEWGAKYGLDPNLRAGYTFSGLLTVHKPPRPLTDAEKAYHQKWHIDRHDKEHAVMGHWQAALDAAPVHTGTGYRGLLHVSTHRFQVGSKFTINADSSASKDHAIGAKFATREAVTHNEPGDDGPSFDSGDGILLRVKGKFADLSGADNPHEQEIIMRQGTTYRVTGHGETGKTEHGSYQIVDVEEAENE